MKFMRIAVAVAFAVAYGNAYAFHAGGVAECEGCHTMHNTKGSGAAKALALGVGTGAAYLLQGTDQSSTCLNCHNSPDSVPSSYHISTDETKFSAGILAANDGNKPPVEMTPGGDFGWLKVTRTYVLRNNPVTVAGSGRGHNVVAADYNYVADDTNLSAPGPTGTPYPATKLACTSCHDPHGKYRRDSTGAIATTGLPIFNSGSYDTSKDPIPGVSAVGVYRILGGKGYLPKSGKDIVDAFNTDPPAAVAPSTYNRSEATTQTVVAYGQGMSEWCANCHGKMLENAYVSGAAGHAHPAGNAAKLNAIAANYNAYVKSGILSGDGTKAFSSLAPVEFGTNDYAVLKTKANITGTFPTVDASANVSCLSCHRAHASAFDFATRFFLEGEFMTDVDTSNKGMYAPATNTKIGAGLGATEQAYAYYQRDADTAFGPLARNYCNKCHAKD